MHPDFKKATNFICKKLYFIRAIARDKKKLIQKKINICYKQNSDKSGSVGAGFYCTRAFRRQNIGYNDQKGSTSLSI